MSGSDGVWLSMRGDVQAGFIGFGGVVLVGSCGVGVGDGAGISGNSGMRQPVIVNTMLSKINATIVLFICFLFRVRIASMMAQF